MHCVILAGGLGTRMRPHTEKIPKALIPVAGQPFVHHQLSLLAAKGVTRIVFCLGYRGEMIEGYVGDGSAWGLEVDYAHEGDELKGTAGALRVALDNGLLPDVFLLLYGDSYLPIRYRPVLESFESSAAEALMTVFRNDHRWDASNVLFERGQVVVYDKRRQDPRSAAMAHIDYGLGALTGSLVDKYVPRGAVADLADIYHELSIDGRLAGYEVRDRFYEVGSPDGVAELEARLRSRSLSDEAGERMNADPG